ARHHVRRSRQDGHRAPPHHRQRCGRGQQRVRQPDAAQDGPALLVGRGAGVRRLSPGQVSRDRREGDGAAGRHVRRARQARPRRGPRARGGRVEMRAWALGTGSSGNALVLEAGDGRIVIDAGFAPREMARRLRAVDIAPESIEALIITHEHHDHARGAASCATKWRWHTYASAGTWRSLRCPRTGTSFVSGATLELRTMSVRTTRIAHDAAEPVALVATARDSGERLGVAYDVGHATRSLVDALSGLDALVLESN